MQDNEKKPALRFKGFTDPWEQRKLEEYLEVSGQKNFDGIYSKEDVLSVSGDFGIVNQIEFQGRSFAGASVANYGVVETGDIVYTKSPLKSNPYGIIKANKGKNGIVSTLYAVYKPKQSANPEFVQIYFEQDARMNNYMHPLVNKGAKNDMKVSAENALKGQIVFPDIEEQRTISEFFRNLDTLITLHQRKYEKLVNIKKSMLDKMFPQNGASVPEIRFKGFTDPWEQRKLGEISSIKTGPFGTQLSAKEYVESGVPVINVKNIGSNAIIAENLDYVSGETFLRLKEHILHNGDIVFGRKGALNRHAMIQKTQDGWIQGSDCIRVKLNVDDSNYLDAYLQVPNVLQHLSKIAYGSTMLTLTTDMLYSVPVELPQLCEEKKIGDFFKILNNLITLHQRKLEKLQNIKKSCLEKMFV